MPFGWVAAAEVGGEAAGAAEVGGAAAGGAGAAEAGGGAAGGSALGGYAPYLLGPAASLLGAGLQSNAASKAAQIQAATTREAIAEQRREYDTTRSDLMPFRSIGYDALPMLRTAMGMQGGDSSSSTFGTLTKPFSFDITQDPGYQFRLDQGLQGVENSASARGTQLSGATLKELMRYGQDYASGEFNAAFGRDQQTKNQLFGLLTGTVGIGSGATTTGVNAGQQTANNIANLTTAQGNSQAASTIAQGNAWSGGLTGAANSLSNAYLLKNIMAQNQTTGGVNQGTNLASLEAGPG